MEKINLGSFVYDKLEENEYLNELYSALLDSYLSLVITGFKKDIQINLKDALSFADLLSKSTSETKSEFHKQLAQEMMTLISELYGQDEVVKQYFGSVLTHNGNYPGLTNQFKGFKSFDEMERIGNAYVMEQFKVPGLEDHYFSHNQKEVYSHFGDQSYSYSGPTSMGKSFMIKNFIKERIKSGEKSNFVFLIPTNALINEINTELHQGLRNVLNENKYKIISVSDSLFLNTPRNHFIFVLTPERLLYLLMNHRDLRIDYLFIDEAHKMINTDGRSTFYYKVVDFLVKREDIKRPKIIFSSPNIPNPDLFQKTIVDSQIEKSSKSLLLSPVNQFKFIVDFNSRKYGIFNTLNDDIEIDNDLRSQTTLNSLITYQSQILSPDPDNRKHTIVYCPSIAKAINHATDFARSLPNPTSVPKELMDFSEELKEDINEDYFLVDLVKKGVAYHVGYLPNKVRLKLEKLFRDRLITVMFCTSTLMEGVNFPAKNLFVTDCKSGTAPFTAIDFKNLIGRVGRIQYNLFGNIFLVNEADNGKLTQKYLKHLTSKVEEQKLSIETGITPQDKQFIAEKLKKGETIFEVKESRKGQTYAEYDLMKKTMNILVYDIVHDNDSLIVEEFKPYIQDDIEEIKEAFEEKTNLVDDDINISTDQVLSLREMIEQKLIGYPDCEVGDPIAQYTEIFKFLEGFCRAFDWDKTEKEFVGPRYADGSHPKFRSLAVLIGKWVNGNGIHYITKDSIKHYDECIGRLKIKVDGQFIPYDGSKFHRNIVIANTLDTIENDIMFTLNNYCIKYSKEYTSIYPTDDTFVDWQLFIQAGSHDFKTIFLQKAGLSRETSLYLRGSEYIDITELPSGKKRLRIKNSVFECKKESVIDECELLKINAPELFID